MIDPLITVIIPVYNTAPYLRRCLDSVCGQTYRNLEIICVNDGSTDGSQAILEEYAARDQRVKVLVQENAGLAAARNTGLDEARGEWVTGVDSDDWLELDTYARLVPHLNAEVDLLCFGCIVDGEITEEYRRGLESYCQIGRREIMNMSPAVLGRMNVYFWNKLYRRAVVEEAKVRFPHGRLYEDAPFLYCFACQARSVCLLPDRLYHYVQRGDSIMGQSMRKTPRALDHLAVVRYTYDYYVQHGKAGQWRAALVFLFHMAYRQTKKYLPELMYERMYPEAWQLARDMGLLSLREHYWVQELRGCHMGRVERLFHRIYANRDSYGPGPLALWTVVHTPQGDVHYCCGRRLFERRRGRC